ncbi:MAG: MgtC/SapB family protein [Elusimicrobia bacterium]|nr:MgtC/SapB family protein [Elusimicrobiota bacterium]
MLEHVNRDIVTIAVSLVLGAVIGLERELSDKAAGLRTNIVICLGATLFTMISQAFPNDPARISAQLVSGIGFLGAGAIMRDGERITGLTTAATIWIVAAIGMAVGYGHFNLAALVTIVVLVVQLAFTPLDILIDDWQQRHTFRITSKFDDKSLAQVTAIFRDARVHIIRHKTMKKNNLYYSEWLTSAARKEQHAVLKKLLESHEVIEVTY